MIGPEDVTVGAECQCGAEIKISLLHVVNTISKRVTMLEKERDAALKYAEQIAAYIVKMHYPDNTEWKLADTLHGVLSQIDNAITRWKDDVLRLEKERDEARALVKRATELAHPMSHPEQWLGYDMLCARAVKRWEGKK
jgi:gas vesicle protein